jgi:hypothetical protein
MEKREVQAQIATVMPKYLGQLLCFDTADGRLDVMISDESAKFIAVILCERYGYFKCGMSSDVEAINKRLAALEAETTSSRSTD